MQDTHIDAAPEYLRSLASTQQVLAALQRAHTAKHTITANAPPAKVQTVDLPEPRARAPLKLFKWDSCQCQKVACSQCSSWVAVVRHSSQTCCAAEPERSHLQLPRAFSVYEVIVYSTTESFQKQQASFCMGTSEPVLWWCQSRPLLGIAHMPPAHSSFRCSLSPELQAEVGVSTEHPAAFTWDAEAQAVQYSLGPQASAIIWGLGGYEWQNMAWSSVDCSHLLMYGQWDGRGVP